MVNFYNREFIAATHRAVGETASEIMKKNKEVDTVTDSVGFKTVDMLGWVATLGGSGDDHFRSSSVSVEEGSTYVYAAGQETSSTGGNSEALISKWDSQGNLIWQKKLGGSRDDLFYSSSVSVEEGSTYVYAAGQETSSTGGNSEALISKWNASGQITQGTLAGIPQLSLADDNLTVGYPGLTTGNPGLAVGNPGLAVGNPALTVGDPNLARVYKAVGA